MHREKTISYFDKLNEFAKKELKENGIARNCPICGIDNTDIVLKGTICDFVKCKKCGLIYAKTILKDISEFYKKNKEYEDGWKNVKLSKTVSLGPVEKKVLKLTKKRNKLLDIGCGFGKVLYSLKPYFNSVEGVEIGEFVSKIAREMFGLQIHKDMNDLKENSYDCIILHQVIEHLDNFELFKGIHRLLHKDGILLIGCPYADSLSMKLFKDKHIHVKSIAHINMFNFKAFRELAKKYGFKIKSIKTDNNLDIRLSDLISLRRNDFLHRNNKMPFNRFSSALFLFANFVLDKTNVLSMLRLGSYLEVVLAKE